jgi:hypothetical protein
VSSVSVSGFMRGDAPPGRGQINNFAMAVCGLVTMPSRDGPDCDVDITRALAAGRFRGRHGQGSRLAGRTARTAIRNAVAHCFIAQDASTS